MLRCAGPVFLAVAAWFFPGSGYPGGFAIAGGTISIRVSPEVPAWQALGASRTQWKAADPDLPVLKQAKDEYVNLQWLDGKQSKNQATKTGHPVTRSTSGILDANRKLTIRAWSVVSLLYKLPTRCLRC